LADVISGMISNGRVAVDESPKVCTGFGRGMNLHFVSKRIFLNRVACTPAAGSHPFRANSNVSTYLSRCILRAKISRITFPISLRPIPWLNRKEPKLSGQKAFLRQPLHSRLSILVPLRSVNVAALVFVIGSSTHATKYFLASVTCGASTPYFLFL
jgi:hypothetical protein